MVSKETHEAVQKALIAFAETDVVPVVRCKDCNQSTQSTAHDDYFDCFLYGTSNHKDYYCAEGERKAENGREEI